MWFRWRPYVSVAQRKQNALKKLKALQKKGQKVSPVVISGRTIAHTFWGKGWCSHLESYSDFENRLPRGRTYVRNGSVVDLQIEEGRVTARVSGSELYKVHVTIKTLEKEKWARVVTECSGKIDSLVELLEGKLSHGVMKVMTHPVEGLFPLPKEISFKCSCPDWASMCKHVAATLYGVGARLDVDPALLFRLRHVDHQELLSAISKKVVAAPTATSEELSAEELGDIFGIDIGVQDKATVKGIKSKVTKKGKTLAITKKATRLPLKIKKTTRKPMPTSSKK
jgi:uncharacterized Zn finger protein